MRRIKELNKLYTKIYLSKKNIILIIFSLVALVSMSYISLNLGFKEEEFYFIKDDYVSSYMESTLNFIMIINCVIIPVIFLPELKDESITLNNILIPRVGKVNLFISKIIVMMKICLIYSLAELLVVGITIMNFYPDYYLSYEYLLTSLFIILYSYFNIILMNISLKILKVFIVGALPILVYLVINFTKEVDEINKFLPYLNINGECLNSYNQIYIILIIDVILTVLYILKD